MYKTIVGIEGMACGMCEEHICSTIKKAFEVNKVKASRSKKCAEIITELPLDEKAVRDAIAPTGYEVTSFACVEEAVLCQTLRVRVTASRRKFLD